MERQSQSIMDVLRMLPMLYLKTRKLPVTDEQASALYSMWLNAPPGQNVLTADAGDDNIKALAAGGFVRVSGAGVEITDKGRKVICEMVTHAPNSLDVNGKMPSYREIKTKASRGGRETFIKKASDTGKRIPTPPFNLTRAHRGPNI